MDAVTAPLKPPLAVPRRLLRLRSDAVLAERFAGGDETAFAVLYERHRASVLAVCMGVLGSNHDAEDAAQDSFSALAVALRGHPPRDLRAWLARVARNAAIDIARRRRRTLTTDAEVPDVPATTVGKGELESVMAGIRELPEGQRTALLMRELAGHSYTEIATLLETDEEAVRGLIARARMSLRTHRDASELPCASARAALAAERSGATREPTVRRHVRGCAPCRAYKQALRDDARALRGLMPVPASGVAGSGAFLGGLAAKGALVGGALTQLTAACAVSACAVGGVVLLYPSPQPHRGAPARVAHVPARPGAAGQVRPRLGQRPSQAPAGQRPSQAAGRAGPPAASRVRRRESRFAAPAAGPASCTPGGPDGRPHRAGSSAGAGDLGRHPAPPASTAVTITGGSRCGDRIGRPGPLHRLHRPP